MNSITKNEFSEITCSASGKVISQFWFNASEHLSEWEFLEQIDTLFSTAEVFGSKVLYIDAFDFCYPINDKSVQQIKVQLDKCNLKFIGIVLSSHLLGKLYILKLLKKMSTPCITLTIFKTRKEGESWVALKNKTIHN
jgi:hypothetical protein